MSTAPSAVTVERPLLQPGQPGLRHVVCCDDDEGTVAFCGTDVSAEPWEDFETPTCVVCADLEGTGVCPRFGTCRFP